MFNKSNQRGFTLIELLVVISIIGILSSFAVVSLNSARAKARDALRKGDMSQIRSALNIYFDDHNAYPTGPGCPALDTGAPDWGATFGCFNAELKPALTNGSKPYMGSIPRDPKNPNNVNAAAGGDDTYLYRYISDGSQYAVVYHIEETPTLQMFKGW